MNQVGEDFDLFIFFRVSLKLQSQEEERVLLFIKNDEGNTDGATKDVSDHLKVRENLIIVFIQEKLAFSIVSVTSFAGLKLKSLKF